MYFVDSGEEAVEILEEVPVDVLVTDLKMIGMDGKEVLKAYAESSPPPVRVVLSGQTQQRAYLDVMSLAHHILTKPTPPSEIEECLDHICALRARIHTPAIKALVSQVGELPSPPDLYRAITAELRDPRASADSVAALVEHDPALVARLLRLVNSGLYRTPAPLSSVRMAIARLGFANFRLVVVGMELLALHEGRTIAEGFSLEVHSAHSARVARLASAIASREHMEAAMTAGLLHEIG